MSTKYLVVFIVLCLVTSHVLCRSVVEYSSIEPVEEESWMRRQLSRIGNTAGKVGNAIGSAAYGAGTTAERICDLVKKIMPILAAICHVGQFKFCATDTSYDPNVGTSLQYGMEVD